MCCGTCIRSARRRRKGEAPMTVHLQAAMPNAPLFRRQVKMKVPEGTTVEEILSLYEEKYRADGLFGRKIGLSVVVNGSRAGLRRELRDQDRVKVFKPMVCG